MIATDVIVEITEIVYTATKATKRITVSVDAWNYADAEEKALRKVTCSGFTPVRVVRIAAMW